MDGESEIYEKILRYLKDVDMEIEKGKGKGKGKVKGSSSSNLNVKKWMIMLKLKMDKYEACLWKYEYIDVMMKNGKIGGEETRLIIDMDFRSQFEVGRPTESYSQLKNALPLLFVGDEGFDRVFWGCWLLRLKCDTCSSPLIPETIGEETTTSLATPSIIENELFSRTLAVADLFNFKSKAPSQKTINFAFLIACKGDTEKWLESGVEEEIWFEEEASRSSDIRLVAEAATNLGSEGDPLKIRESRSFHKKQATIMIKFISKAPSKIDTLQDRF
ncbi:hypothetical protein LguiA_017538 [Lonicera macranthoides]